MNLSARELACDIPMVRGFVRRFWGARFDRHFDDLVSETLLCLLERHDRHPEAHHARSPLLQYASGDATRRIANQADQGGRTVSVDEEVEGRDMRSRLAVPDSITEAEILADRLRYETEEDDSADQLAEWHALSLNARQSRILEACRATGTTPVV